MDVKQSSHLPSGDHPVDPRAPLDPKSDHPNEVRNGIEGAEEAQNRRASELEERTAERTERSRRVAREVSRVVREELLAQSNAADRVELSPAAEAFAKSAIDQTSATEEDRALRNTHLAALKAAIEAGSLHTPERLEHAARRMLGDQG